jgi:hypothetical protein
MPTFLAYIDDSRDNTTACFAAIIVPVPEWSRLQDEIIGFRRKLKASDGIHVTAELHATEFLSNAAGGRGHIGVSLPITRRAAIFNEVLDFIASRQPLSILGAADARVNEDRIFERLLDRFQVYAEKSGKDSHVVVISDEGKNYTPMLRKLRRYNPVTSMFGAWASGESAENLPLDRLVEDIVFRDSRKSSFVQFADFCAFAVLRSETPTARLAALGIDKSYERLRPVLVTQAFRKDPRRLGIIRAT